MREYREYILEGAWNFLMLDLSPVINILWDMATVLILSIWGCLKWPVFFLMYPVLCPMALFARWYNRKFAAGGINRKTGGPRDGCSPYNFGTRFYKRYRWECQNWGLRGGPPYWQKKLRDNGYIK